MKIFKRIVKICFFSVVFILSLIGACEIKQQVHTEEPRGGQIITSEQNPLGTVNAFIVEVNIDNSIMVSQPYEVWLEATKNHKNRKKILSADKTDGLSFTWYGDSTLLVCFNDARIYDFSNHFYIGEGLDFVEINVVLKKVIDIKKCIM